MNETLSPLWGNSFTNFTKGETKRNTKKSRKNWFQENAWSQWKKCLDSKIPKGEKKRRGFKSRWLASQKEIESQERRRVPLGSWMGAPFEFFDGKHSRKRGSPLDYWRSKGKQDKLRCFFGWKRTKEGILKRKRQQASQNSTKKPVFSTHSRKAERTSEIWRYLRPSKLSKVNMVLKIKRNWFWEIRLEAEFLDFSLSFLILKWTLSSSCWSLTCSLPPKETRSFWLSTRFQGNRAFLEKYEIKVRCDRKYELATEVHQKIKLMKAKMAEYQKKTEEMSKVDYVLV